MPGKRRAADRLLERALGALGAALDETRAPWMVIGGVAVIARGVRRTTTDIDAVVRGDAVTVPILLRALARKDIKPRIPDAEAFAQENLVLLLRHEPTGVDLDVSLGWSPFEQEALADRTEAAFGTVRAPMATPGALVVFKAVAARGKDVDDVTALLVLYPEIDIALARRRLAALAELAEAPELPAVLERALAAARPPRRPPRRRR